MTSKWPVHFYSETFYRSEGESVENLIIEVTVSLCLPPDKDLNTEGFSLESCRSMIALMDVSFVSSASGWLCCL